MRKALGVFVLVVGVCFFGLAVHVALFGADPPVPEGGGTVEGALLPGETTASPAGQPFLYGTVRIAEANRGGRRVSTSFVERTFGEPEVRVATDAGAVAVVLPEPEHWRVLETMTVGRTVDSLAGLPLVSDDTARAAGRLMTGPFRLTVKAARPGDYLIAEVDGGRVVRAYFGDRATLEANRGAREAARWPVVALLATMGIISLVGSAMLVREPRQAA